jgi:hypothetical protein
MRPQFSEFLETSEVLEYAGDNHSQGPDGQADRIGLLRDNALSLTSMRQRAGRQNTNWRPSRRFGSARVCCSVAIVLSLLFQAALPLVHQRPRTDNPAGIPDWILASLCSGAGAAETAANGADETDGSQPTSPKPPRCPVCLAAQLASLLSPPPAIANLPPPIDRDGRRHRLADAELALVVPLVRPQARAPPLAV